jgi:hypothetical protein
MAVSVSDVFISYAREDKPEAELVAQALERDGVSVWWDRNIPPGRSYDEVIEEALDAAKCVIVLWSRKSVASDWVKVEAGEGNKRGVLVPALIEEAKVPLEFRRLQTANLIGWEGENKNPEFRQFLSAVAAHIGQSGSRTEASPLPSFIAAQEPPRTSRKAAWRATLVSTERLLRTLRIDLSHDSHVVEWRESGFALNTVTVDGIVAVRIRGRYPLDKRFEFDIKDGMQICSAQIMFR